MILTILIVAFIGVPAYSQETGADDYRDTMAGQIANKADGYLGGNFILSSGDEYVEIRVPDFYTFYATKKAIDRVVDSYSDVEYFEPWSKMKNYYTTSMTIEPYYVGLIFFHEGESSIFFTVYKSEN